MTIPLQTMGLRVTKVGLNYKINLELIGLSIIWDTQRMINIEATAALFNRTAGLCGTLDQDPLNDFTSKSGILLKVSRIIRTKSHIIRTKSHIIRAKSQIIHTGIQTGDKIEWNFI